MTTIVLSSSQNLEEVTTYPSPHGVRVRIGTDLFMLSLSLDEARTLATQIQNAIVQAEMPLAAAA